MRLRGVTLTIALAVYGLLALSLTADPIRDGTYVTVRDAHFSVDGKRLRLWGVNLSVHHVGDYRGAEVTIQRMKRLGFNCIHLWLPKGALHAPGKPYLEFRTSRKGDGSVLDLFDYIVYLCRQNGMYVSLPCLSVRLDEITEDAFDVLPGGSADERREWFEGVRSSGKGFRQLKFVDERVAALYFAHARYFLNRVNPYTGKRYAEEECIAFYELEDGMSFLAWPPDIGNGSYFSRRLSQHWFDFLESRFHSESEMAKAWGDLFPGESLSQRSIKLFPTRKLEQVNPRRLADTWEFLYGLSSRFHRDHLALVRSQAPKGVGINVQPIATDSLIYNRPGLMFAALSHSDFVCGTGFQTGGQLVEEEGTFRWRPATTFPPPWKWHYATDASCLRVEGMPYCPVAGASRTNDPFRAMNPLIRAIWASWQDWDGVFAYWWGYFADGKPIRSDADYAREPLRVATPDHPSRGFEICHDEIMLAQHRTASSLFRQGLIRPAGNPPVIRIGCRALFGPPASDYYHLRWPSIPRAAWQVGARIQFDSQWDGKVQLADAENGGSIGPLTWSNGVLWDWPRGRVVVDTPHVKALAGMIDGGFAFSGGIALKDVNREFVCFTLASEDGRPLESSHRAVLSMVSTSANTGYHFDSTRVTKNRFGMPEIYSGCVNPGRWPVVVERVGARVLLPLLKGRVCRKLDFALREIETTGAETETVMKPDEPVFFCELVVP